MRIVMMGTGTFAEPAFEALLASPHAVVGLVTQPDRAGGQERGSTRQTGRGMKNMALGRAVPILQPQSINTSEGVVALAELRPDLLVVAAYGQILSNQVLTVPPQGGINIHASFLPKYRGAAPVAWAIYHGEKSTGVTIIRMTTGLDAGDMLARASLEIGPDETAGELETRLAPLGARLALEVIDQLAAGTVKGTSQDRSLATKAPKLTKEHGLIDWSRRAEEVCNQIRAMQPWPTAYTFWHQVDKPAFRLLVARAAPSPVRYDPKILAGTPFCDPQLPGSLFITAGEVSATERSVIEVLELQPAGKRRMAAAEFLRGHLVRAGDRLGAERL